MARAIENLQLDLVGAAQAEDRTIGLLNNRRADDPKFRQSHCPPVEFLSTCYFTGHVIEAGPLRFKEFLRIRDMPLETQDHVGGRVHQDAFLIGLRPEVPEEFKAQDVAISLRTRLTVTGRERDVREPCKPEQKAPRLRRTPFSWPAQSWPMSRGSNFPQGQTKCVLKTAVFETPGYSLRRTRNTTPPNFTWPE